MPETRKRFLHPNGPLTAAVVYDCLQLVSIDIGREGAMQWTEFELLLAYDYAIREHMHASDVPFIRRRQLPSFVNEAANKRLGMSRSAVSLTGSGRVVVNDHIEVMGRGVEAHYTKGEVRLVYDGEHLTFLSDELDKAGVVKVELANFAAICAGSYRVTARGFTRSGIERMLHSSGSVCGHGFRPEDRTMFGEWRES